MTTSAPVESVPFVLRLGPSVRLGNRGFFELCQLNRDLRIERTRDGEILVMPPTGSATGARNAALTAQLHLWAVADGTGVAFDSSSGFALPNGAVRSPDASWIRRERLDKIETARKEQFLPLCPDFAAELRSPTDPLETLRAKMREYLEVGLRLGWLVDPIEARVEVYWPDQEPAVHELPDRLSGDPVLPGFSLDLTRIWNPYI